MMRSARTTADFPRFAGERSAERADPLGRLFEKGFVFVAILLLTGAGIPMLQTESSDLYDSTSGIQTYTWLLVGVYFVTLLLSLIHMEQVIKVVLRSKWILALTILAPLSTFWSTVPGLSLQRGIVVMLTTVFAFYVAARFSPRELLTLLAWSFAVAMIGSVLYAIALPGVGTMEGRFNGAWRGVYFHKNALGRLLDIALLVYLLLALEAPRKRFYLWGASLIAVGIIFMSQSATAVVTAALVVALIPIYRVLQRSKSFYPIVLAVITLAFGAVLAFRFGDLSTTLGALGKDETLTGRTELWPYLIDFAQDKLWFGYGYTGFWLGWDEPSGYIWWLFPWQPSHAHNGFLDLVLDLGLIGLVVFCILTVHLVRITLTYARQQGTWISLAPLLLLSAFLNFNITQSVILDRSNGIWVLVVAMMASTAIHVSDSTQRDEVASVSGAEVRGNA